MKRFFTLFKKLFQKIYRRITIGNEKPKILTDAGFDFYWDDSKFQAMVEPITEINIEELKWNLNLPFWEEEWINDWNLTPREVIEHPEYHKNHYQRIKKSDLNYPICITKNKYDKWFVLDGTHRLAKAYINNKKIAKVKIIPNEKLLEIKEYKRHWK